jgi:hypothetical protein
MRGRGEEKGREKGRGGSSYFSKLPPKCKNSRQGGNLSMDWLKYPLIVSLVTVDGSRESIATLRVRVSRVGEN